MTIELQFSCKLGIETAVDRINDFNIKGIFVEREKRTEAQIIGAQSKNMGNRTLLM
ncbi:MAG: hypothetical protein WBW79_05160 [Desulfocapsaceae bacterium]